MMRYCMALADVFATVFAISVAGSAQDFMVELGAPTALFSKPDRSVADTISPIWHDEKERDAAAEDNRPEDLRSLRRRVRDLRLQNVVTSLG
jgi:hypothetical protein